MLARMFGFAALKMLYNVSSSW